MITAVTNEYLRKEFDNFEKEKGLGNLLEELKYSTLIAPVDENKTGCAMITAGDEIFIPLFTDIYEYQKVDFKGNFHPEAFDFNFYLELLKNGLHGFIVNVESERFPVTREFLDFMDTDYMFDLDYQPFTKKEISEIFDNLNNSELSEFIKNERNCWDSEKLMEILLKSDILAPVASKKSFDDDDVVISVNGMNGLQYCRSEDKFSLIFSAPDKIHPPHRNANFYCRFVNLPLFIDYALRSDLAGIKLDENIVLSREFLMDFMKNFSSPCIDTYDGYIFRI